MTTCIRTDDVILILDAKLKGWHHADLWTAQQEFLNGKTILDYPGGAMAIMHRLYGPRLIATHNPAWSEAADIVVHLARQAKQFGEVEPNTDQVQELKLGTMIARLGKGQRAVVSYRTWDSSLLPDMVRADNHLAPWHLPFT